MIYPTWVNILSLEMTNDKGLHVPCFCLLLCCCSWIFCLIYAISTSTNVLPPIFFNILNLSIYPSIHPSIYQSISSIFSVNLSIDLFHSLNIDIYKGGSPGLVVMGKTPILKVMGSNPGTVYWMDIFLKYLLQKLYCLFEKTENKRKSLFNSVGSKLMFYVKVCRWLDSNHWPLVLQVTTEPQPMPNMSYVFEDFLFSKMSFGRIFQNFFSHVCAL